MRKFLLYLCLMGAAASTSAQNYDILTYHLNTAPVNGIKIKTNLPFVNGSQMPAIRIEGFCFGSSEPIGLLLTYYIYNDVFYRPRVSAYGPFAPPIYLANEAGKVVIFLDSKTSYPRFSVHAFARGRPAETAANFEGWTVVDEAISDTASTKLQAEYLHRFAGNANLPDGIWNSNGNVGIGTANPSSRLTVDGGSTSNGIKMLSDGDDHTYNSLQLTVRTTSNLQPDKPFNWVFASRKDGYFSGDTTGPTAEIYAIKKAGGYFAPLLFKSNGDIVLAGAKNATNGNVGIGTTDTKGYKLAVAGSMIAEKVKIKMQSGWPDYVFHSDYQLPKLREVAAYVTEHKHLPGIPAASEIAQEGLDLGEMNKQLLKKIEELTLYIIQQDKRIEQLEEKVSHQHN